MKTIDLTPTGDSYFANQRTEYDRVLKNAMRFKNERCPSCNHKWNK
jgi:hypothetical protein